MLGSPNGLVVGSPIDFALPFNRGIRVCQFPIGQSWVNFLGTQPVDRLGGAFGAGKFGPSRQHTGTGDRTRPIISDPRLPGGPATVMVIYAKRDTTNRVSGLFGFEGNSTTDLISAHGPFSDGNIYWDYGGQSSGTNRLSVAATWVAGAPSVWFFTTGKRGMEIWRDGKKLASNSANPTRATNVGQEWKLGCHKATNSDFVDHYGVCLWDGQLDVPAIAMLSQNPYALFRDPAAIGARKTYASGGGGGGPAARRRQMIVC